MTDENKPVHVPTPQEERLARIDVLLPRSLQTIIDSLNFRDYEKAMARELLSLRRSHAALTLANKELREALKEYDDAFTEFNADSKPSRDRMRMAVIGARDALARNAP